MAIVDHNIILDSLQADSRRYVKYEYIWHNARKDYRGPKIISLGFDAEADIVNRIPTIENSAAQDEINDQMDLIVDGVNPDKVAEYQSQSDFDRRLLARLMFVENAHHLHAAYPFFQAVESRGGVNANQRASYLGVSSSEYGLVEDRFNSVNGVAWFLADEKNQVWGELPSEDWN